MYPSDHNHTAICDGILCQCAFCIAERQELKFRILRGATLLDRVVPGWEERVDVSALDMHWGTSHLLVQVLGQDGLGFALALLFAGKEMSEAEIHEQGYALGFLPSTRFFAKELECEWIELLLYRAMASLEEQ